MVNSKGQSFIDGFIKSLTEINAIIHIFKNPNRKKIYELVQREKLTIKQISDKIELSYQNTFEHINVLERYNLIKKEYGVTKKAKVVYIIKNKTYEDLLNEKGLNQFNK